MKVDMTNAAVRGLIQCLDGMKESKLSLPTKVWYTLAWNRQQLNIAASAAEDVRLKIVKDMGKKDAKTGTVRIPDSKIPDFTIKYNELLTTETTVEIRKISLEQLGDSAESMQGINGIFDFFTHMIEEPDMPKLTPVKELKTVEA